MKQYFPPMSLLCEAMGTTPAKVMEDGVVGVPTVLLRYLIKCALSDLEFDVEVYRSQNNDMNSERRDRALESHFKETGYFEGRLLPARFDADYYPRRYKDVFEAIKTKEIRSALKHYYDQGIKECRAPSRDLEKPIAEWIEVSTAAQKTLSRHGSHRQN